MNTISFAIASIVDAHVDQGYTRQIIKASTTRLDSQIQYGREIRSKLVFDLVGSVISYFGGLIDKIKERAQERRAIEQILRLKPRMVKDIGLAENDLQALRFGLLSLDELNQRRNMRQLEREAKLKPGLNAVRKSILDFDSVNEDCFEYAKCS